MEIVIISDSISLNTVKDMASKQFGDVIKATVDVDKKIMALGGDLHADEEQLLLENDSKQNDLWGINLYPAKFGTPDFIEFDSMINLRPNQGNMSRSVEDKSTQEQIIAVVNALVVKDK